MLTMDSTLSILYTCEMIIRDAASTSACPPTSLSEALLKFGLQSQIKQAN